MTALLLTFVLALGPSQPVALAPGEVISVHEAGDGRPIVLVPGLAGCAYGYRKITGPLHEAGFRTLVIEPLGFGASSRPAKADYSLTAQADRLAAVMDQRGLRDAVVVGHGVSGSIVLRLAYRRPDLVAAVLSIEGGPQERAGNPSLDRTLGLASLIIKAGGGRLLRDRYKKNLVDVSGDSSWADRKTVGRYLRNIDRDLGAFIQALRAMARAPEPESLHENLERIACPVLLLVGESNPRCTVPAGEIALMETQLSDFTRRPVPGAGHFIFEEQPEAVVDAVKVVDPRQGGGS